MKTAILDGSQTGFAGTKDVAGLFFSAINAFSVNTYAISTIFWVPGVVGIEWIRPIAIAGMLISTILILSVSQISVRTLTRIITVLSVNISVVTLLIGISVFAKKNDIPNVVAFFSAFQALALVPSLVLYGLERNLTVLLRVSAHASLALNIIPVLIGISLVFGFEIGLFFTLDDYWDNLYLSVPRGLPVPRIVLKTSILGVALLYWVLLYSNMKRWYKIIYSLTIVSAVLMSQTIGMIISMIAVVFLVVLNRRNGRLAAIAVFVSVTILAGIAVKEILSTDSTKDTSTAVKKYQVEIAVDELAESPFFGKGFGFMIFDDPSGRDLSEGTSRMEVGPAMLLYFGGIIGGLLLAALYFSPYFLGYLSNASVGLRKSYKVAGIAYILVTTLNPYAWSGGVGLFVVSIVYAQICIGRPKRRRQR